MKPIQKIAVAGAGTMGVGIARLSAIAGFDTVLYDISASQTEQAKQSLTQQLDKEVSKGQLSATDKEKVLSKILFTNNVAEVVADLVIEAIVENIDIKRKFFNELVAINGDSAILASNTSSFSITRIAAGIAHPERIVGMHFFNPPHIMKLVEVIEGVETSHETAATIKAVAQQMGKTVVMVKDSPGFIVNRVARHYYVESLKILEERVSDFESIDALAEASGFKMGPFRLMDMIGMDINYTVTKSLYEAFHFEPKFRPNRIQQQKNEAGHLGRKTGKGFYEY